MFPSLMFFQVFLFGAFVELLDFVFYETMLKEAGVSCGRRII